MTVVLLKFLKAIYLCLTAHFKMVFSPRVAPSAGYSYKLQVARYMAVPF